MIKVILNREYHEEITFNIDTNFRTAILGENGIGKSIILKKIAKLDVDENWCSAETPTKTKVAYFSQIEKNDLQISGGEHTKQRLEKLFQIKADLYVLDEPTNNLDQKNIDWLKKYILKQKLRIVFTSHNINFIDDIAEVIFYMDSKSVEKTQKKCSIYLEDRKKRIEKEYVDYELSLRTHKRLLDSTKQAQAEFEAGSKWEDEDKMLQGFKREMAGKFGGATVKRLAKRAEQFNIDEPENDPIPRVKLHFIKKMANLLDFSGDTLANKKISFRLSSGDKLIIMGKNGVGKTTLIEKIIGYFNGSQIKAGDNFTKIGRIKNFYLSQNWYEKIDDEIVIDYLMKIFSEKEDAYRALAYNHLEPEILIKKFKDLSPGVRIKILLGVLSHSKYDLIIWDEPTNHLDVMTQYILHQAFVDYEGALIIITHDAKLINDEHFQKIEI
jgi:ATPase subunit of ABC transporter with duplicated ATPase domains